MGKEATSLNLVHQQDNLIEVEVREEVLGDGGICLDGKKHNLKEENSSRCKVTHSKHINSQAVIITKSALQGNLYAAHTTTRRRSRLWQ